MHVICVDDEPLAAEYTVKQCQLVPGVEDATGFTDAFDALEWIKSHPTELAVLDINMPQINGITLAARIKEITPQTAILFLTAYKEYAFDAYEVHPAGYLLKPVSQRSLMSAALRMLPAPRISGSRPSASLTSTWTGNRWDSNLQKRKRSLPFLWISRVPAQPAPSCSPPFGKTGHMTARCKNRLTYTFVLCGRRFVNTGFRKLWRWKKEYSA